MTEQENQLLEMIRKVVNTSLEAFQRDQVKTVSDIQSRFEAIDKQISDLKTSMEVRAQERANAEVVVARQQLAIAEERANSLSTQERIQVKEMFEEEADRKSKQRAQKRQEFWDRVLPNVATGVIMILAAPITLAIVAIIIIFLARVFQVQITPP